jgi:protein O-mannosyl-transferase
VAVIRRFSALGFALFLTLLALVVYHGAMRNSRLPEEGALIWDNPAITGPIMTRVFQGVWESGEFRPQIRPVPTIMRVVEHLAWDYDRGKYQRDQIVLHAIAGLLLFLVIRKWTRSVLGAGVAGLIFVLHPVASQSVLYLGGLSEILCAIFCLGSLLAIPWDKTASGRRLIATGILAFVAMLSKEVGFVLPFVLTGIFLSQRPGKPWAMRSALPVGLATIAALAYRFVALGTMPGALRKIPAVDPATGMSGVSLIPRAIAGVGVEVSTILFPLRLNHDYSWLLVQRGGGLIVFMLMAMAGIAALALVAGRSKNPTVIGFALLAGLPLIAGAAFAGPSGVAASDRFAYLSLAGCAGLVPVFGAWLVRKRHDFGPVLLGIVIGILLLYGVRTAQRTRDYGEMRDLLESSRKVRPANPQVLYEMGNLLLSKGDYSGAIGMYKPAIALRPEFLLAGVNLGAAYLAQEDLGMALRTLDPIAVASRHVRALRLVYAKANYHAGIVLMKQERFKEAAEAFERMLVYYPDSFGARLNLGLIYIKAPHYAERGIALLQQVLIEEHDPDRRAAVEKGLNKAQALLQEYLDKNGTLPSPTHGALGEPWKVVAAEGL